MAPERVTIYYQGITDRTRATAYPQELRYVIGSDQPGPEPGGKVVLRQAEPVEPRLPDLPGRFEAGELPRLPDLLGRRTAGLAEPQGPHGVPTGATCPASHPVVVPRLEFLITYPVNGAGLTLAGTRNGQLVTTAPGYPFHGDFLNAWDPAELQRRVDNYIKAGYICGTDGKPSQQ
ncbi:uncharacterized protein DUF1996 [Kribbella sp. VKM Ac-2568]|nr:DUF1996 domain-containing protein [Kribbella sp. VKM Ac-2568]TCM38282.1 uncharacterized protein DUF1996 [Kribbella sp. VKM Ac-2568]